VIEKPCPAPELCSGAGSRAEIKNGHLGFARILLFEGTIWFQEKLGQESF